MADHSELQIRVVPVVESASALWLLFGTDTETARRDRVTATLRVAATQENCFVHLLEARRAETRVGAVWGQLLPGQNANIWPPGVVAGEPLTTAVQLQSALDQRLAEAGLVMAQSLLPVTATGSANCLRQCGYVRAAGLLYLISNREQFPGGPIASHLDFISYRKLDSQRMAALIEATYIGTQDVPMLDGIRSTQDVMAGYQATGAFAPDRWFFAQFQGTDVGCLLLTDHPALDNWELVYLGLVPAARGKGWGTELVRFAQYQTGRANRAALLVSVDAANEPAVMAYSRCGFNVLDRREVWIKRFR